MERVILQLSPATGHVRFTLEDNDWTVPVVAYAIVERQDGPYAGETITGVEPVVIIECLRPELLGDYLGRLGADRPNWILSTEPESVGKSRLPTRIRYQTAVDGGQLNPVPPVAS